MASPQAITAGSLITASAIVRSAELGLNIRQSRDLERQTVDQIRREAKRVGQEFRLRGLQRREQLRSATGTVQAVAAASGVSGGFVQTSSQSLALGADLDEALDRQSTTETLESLSAQESSVRRQARRQRVQSGIDFVGGILSDVASAT